MGVNEENWEDGLENFNDDEMFNGTGETEDENGARPVNFVGSRPPSAKQIKFAEKIARVTKIPLTAEARAEGSVISEYIEKNKDKLNAALLEHPELDDGPAKPPSEKQLAFARLISGKLEKALPAGVDSDWRIARKFIDAHGDEFKTKFPAGQGGGVKSAPSEKQMKLANLLSERAGVPLPDGIDEDWRIARKFIDAYKGVLDSQDKKPPRRK